MLYVKFSSIFDTQNKNDRLHILCTDAKFSSTRYDTKFHANMYNNIPLSRKSLHFLVQANRLLEYPFSISALCSITWRKLSHSLCPLSERFTVRLYFPISQKLSLVAVSSSWMDIVIFVLTEPPHSSPNRKKYIV